MQLDKKDRRILLELDKNARASYAEIGKNVRLAKGSVLHRIKKLEENNVILNYHTIIDTMKLGYTTYDVYFKFNNTTPEDEQRIIDFLTAHQQVWFVVSTTGSVDLVILISTKTATQYHQIWEEIHKEIKPFVRIVRTAVLVKYVHFTRNYLLPEESTHKQAVYVGELGNESIDETDHKILRLLAKNAKISAVELTQHVHLTASAIMYRIRNLEKKGIIQGYRASINFQKLGFEYFKILMTLNDLAIKPKLIQWVTQQPSVVYYDEFIGGYDVEFDIEITSTQEFMQLLTGLKERFGANIQEINHFMGLLFHKSTYYPET